MSRNKRKSMYFGPVPGAYGVGQSSFDSSTDMQDFASSDLPRHMLRDLEQSRPREHLSLDQTSFQGYSQNEPGSSQFQFQTHQPIAGPQHVHLENQYEHQNAYENLQNENENSITMMPPSVLPPYMSHHGLLNKISELNEVINCSPKFSEFQVSSMQDLLANTRKFVVGVAAQYPHSNFPPHLHYKIDCVISHIRNLVETSDAGSKQPKPGVKDRLSTVAIKQKMARERTHQHRQSQHVDNLQHGMNYAQSQEASVQNYQTQQEDVDNYQYQEQNIQNHQNHQNRQSQHLNLQQGNFSNFSNQRDNGQNGQNYQIAPPDIQYNVHEYQNGYQDDSQKQHMENNQTNDQTYLENAQSHIYESESNHGINQSYIETQVQPNQQRAQQLLTPLSGNKQLTRKTEEPQHDSESDFEDESDTDTMRPISKPQVPLQHPQYSPSMNFTPQSSFTPISAFTPSSDNTTSVPQYLSNKHIDPMFQRRSSVPTFITPTKEAAAGQPAIPGQQLPTRSDFDMGSEFRGRPKSMMFTQTNNSPQLSYHSHFHQKPQQEFESQYQPFQQPFQPLHQSSMSQHSPRSQQQPQFQQQQHFQQHLRPQSQQSQHLQHNNQVNQLNQPMHSHSQSLAQSQYQNKFQPQHSHSHSFAHQRRTSVAQFATNAPSFSNFSTSSSGSGSQNGNRHSFNPLNFKQRP